jgi:hypothetical protein
VHVPSSAHFNPATVTATDSIMLTTEERLNVAIKNDGGLKSFDVQGMLFPQGHNQDDGCIQL